MSSAGIKTFLSPLSSYVSLTAHKYQPVHVDTLRRAGLKMMMRSEMNAPDSFIIIFGIRELAVMEMPQFPNEGKFCLLLPYNQSQVG